MQQDDLYDPAFVRALFDEMSATYGVVNLITSFGFAWRWRWQCLDRISISQGIAAVDLMSGMGELYPTLSRKIGSQGSVTAVDLSSEMCKQAKRYENGRHRCPILILQANALESGLPDESADLIVSSFGLKTFSRLQLEQLAREVIRILKPGGQISFVEISVPDIGWLRKLYLFYLVRVIPLAGRIFLGNPENYRMLGVYTRKFRNCDETIELFRNVGLQIEKQSYFFGCASGFSGRKSES